ncbi:glutamate 5-kinase [Aquiflexum sp. LQ15W]|uniref:glutamate 5-kinase n=1 Tax=Cognataquiflexum nitidum TaxID=2922272 RepID=UPI001F1489E8|nr:glutamate 5-kinase [Cognataquiflexum nitidum]MCH6199238.1 glutamate 5-kinase [Cognataquiflexum nitidum]
MLQKPEILVIKIGSNVLTKEGGHPDRERMDALVTQIASLKSEGIKVLLVSSGAVAFGRGEISLPEKIDPILKKQIWASNGQIDLINTYKGLFKKHHLTISQILVTKEDFRDRKHYLNMRNCLLGLIAQGIVPVINENDTVAITELMFTDNDELASLTAAMVNADSMILLTNVDGIFDGNPNDPNSKLISIIGNKMPDLGAVISPLKSSFGRGGMLTKTNMAKKAAELGIQVWIANGKKENILTDVINQKAISTYFEPKPRKQSPKKWLAHGDQYFKGEVVINEGAKNALTSNKISSLLPVGMVMIKGEFSKGDIIRITDESGTKIGLGKAEYHSPLAKEKIGQKNQKPFIHYDYLYLFQNG